MRLLVSVSVCVCVLLLGRSGAGAADCKEDEVQCGDLDQCVPKSAICDGRPWCRNEWDEQNCTSCKEKVSFMCDGSHCVNNNHKCDGLAWCRDGTDEANCTSIQIVQMCRPSSRCNGVVGDCFLGDDEIDCTPDQCQAPATKESFSGGKCRDPNARCNGVRNHWDEDDEENCTECHSGSLLCGSRCQNPKDVCDGVSICSKGEDELNCTSCKGNSFLCDGSRCVHNDHKCDGFAWCRDGTDEANCTSIRSEPVCKASSRCNGVDHDCSTLDDEIGCTPDMCQEPASSSTYCDGRCRKASSWCNGFPDCLLDGADEADCPRTY